MTEKKPKKILLIGQTMPIEVAGSLLSDRSYKCERSEVVSTAEFSMFFKEADLVILEHKTSADFFGLKHSVTLLLKKRNNKIPILIMAERKLNQFEVLFLKARKIKWMEVPFDRKELFTLVYQLTTPKIVRWRRLVLAIWRRLLPRRKAKILFTA